MFIWTISDVLSIVFFALIVLMLLAMGIAKSFQQARCRHDGGYTETSACDAICRKCGKNLGFIGSQK